MKKMLMLGGSHAEVPMIRAARDMGYYVITTGNQTDGMGHKYADQYINCDFSDKEAILALAKKEQVEAVCSGCNDFACLSAAYTCEMLGLGGHDSYETALSIHHKDKYRALAQKLGILSPKAQKCRIVEELKKICMEMQFPIMVKPVDLTGGKGMRRCDNEEQAEKAFLQAMAATRESYIILEEFITGTNHGFSAYLQDGKVTFYFMDNEQYYHNPYLVSGASAPGDVPKQAIEQLCKDSEKLAGALGLVDGILHIQFILKEDNTPVIIEVCRRAPGDLYIRLVELAGGLDYPAYIVAAEAGIRMPVPDSRRMNGFYVRHCIMADETGKIEGIQIAEEIKPYIVEQLLWGKKDDKVEDIMKYKAGIVFLHFKEEKEYRYYINRLTELMKVRIQKKR